MEKLYRAKQIIEMLGISKATWYNWIKNGQAPKGQEINGIVRWSESMLREWNPILFSAK